ncbi:MAG TPA: hypothetical protein DIT17_06640 [Enterococcus faecalis]|nr:hypothetical protein [Enterococcus faecalis]
MKIAIHHRQGSFSDRWIKYCEKNNIDYKLVNAFDNNIIEQLQDCDVFMWHHHHAEFKDVLVAKKILFALEHRGIKVFPDFRTGWHFDDKVAQKYLLEAINAPLIPSYVFYNKKEALDWAENTVYPKVFKLKGGAGASNVKLVENTSQAIALINRAFGRGFLQFDRIGHLKERFNKFRNGKNNFISVLKSIARIFILPEFAKQQSREKGYIYFQEFISNNKFDTRVVVINGRISSAEKRFIRKNDFRASGSGEYEYNDINLEIIKNSFEIAEKLQLQSVAFDYVLNDKNKPLIVEMSYGFGTKGIEKAPGYWDREMNWYEGEFNPQDIIINELIKDKY